MIVEGRLVTEEWTDSGNNKKSRVVMDVEKVHFTGSKKDNTNGEKASEETDIPNVEEADLPF